MTNADDEGDDFDSLTSPTSSGIQVNRYFAEHPEMVLGAHALKRGIYGPAPVYTCRPRKDGVALETLLTEALDRLPAGIVTAPPESTATSTVMRSPARPGALAPRRMAPPSRKVPISSAQRAS